MARRIASYDKPLLYITATLIGFGLLMFVSASFSVIADDKHLFFRLLTTQIGLGLGGGLIAAYGLYRLPIRYLRQWAPWLLFGALAITALVFVPGIGIRHGGANRWLDLGFTSFQPAELLKFAVIVYLAAWYTYMEKRIQDWRFGLLPLLVVLGLAGGVLLAQPDTGTLIVIALASVTLYFLAGAKARDIGIVALVGVIMIISLIITRPYVLDRFKTFLDPSHDPLGASYQVRQALTTLGSGQIWGRGYGQSVQKFDYLPEPTGDAIFAVIGEELGLLGTVTTILLYLAFAFRGLWVASRIRSRFESLLVSGIVITITVQAFVNIAAIINIIPLTGLPLIFMSQGGSALLVSLASVGLVLQLSRYKETDIGIQ